MKADKFLNGSSSLANALHFQGVVAHTMGEYDLAALHFDEALKVLKHPEALGFADDQFLDLGSLINDSAVNCIFMGNVVSPFLSCSWFELGCPNIC